MEPNFKLSTGSYKVFKFPSGELQVQLIEAPSTDYSLTITGSILSSDNLMELLQLRSILTKQDYKDTTLVMPYCAYSRQDRICNKGESLSIKIFCNLINFLEFTKVYTYDNHSDVSTALINNCINIHVKYIIKSIDLSNYDYFISPDAGANKKVFECSKEFKIPMLRADKTRDVSTGKILETVIYAKPEQLENSTVLIIDDICQGGRTFEELSKAIKALAPTCTIHLYTTHGFYSNGLDSLRAAGIDKFITTDSVYTLKEKDVLLCEVSK